MAWSARREFEERGDESELHIIIFDEIDSVNLRSDRRDERRDMASLTTRCMRRSHVYSILISVYPSCRYASSAARSGAILVWATRWSTSCSRRLTACTLNNILVIGAHDASHARHHIDEALLHLPNLAATFLFCRHDQPA